MATLSTTRPTLLDHAQRMDPNGQVAKIGEILTKQNAVLDDIVWKEGNQTAGHQYTLRTAKPAVSWRQLNQGVAPTKSNNSQYTDVCGSIAAYNEVDKKVAAMNGNTADFRMSEAVSTIESMNDEFVSSLIYADVLGAPEEMTGIAPRYATLSGGTTSNNILSAGGSGSDNTSIFLVGWGNDTIFGIYPKGSKAGLSYQDLGEVTLLDASSNPFQGYRSYHEWDCGLAVQNWKYIVRICNIDVSKLLTADEATDVSAHITKLMLQAIHKIPNLAACKPVFYMNETVLAMLDVKLEAKGNLALSVKDITGPNGFERPTTMHYRGIPCKKVESILSTETVVS